MSVAVVTGLAEALTLTNQMRDAFESGELEQATEIGSRRDQLLRDSFSSGAVSESDTAEVKALVKQIMALNDEMLGLAQQKQDELKDKMKGELEQELKSSSAIRSYIDHME